MDHAVHKLFERYEAFFRRSLAGEIDPVEAAALYAPEFIAASPAGVRAGRNDGEFRAALVQGYAQYRAIGTREMRIRHIRLSPMDAHHCVAHVAWTAIYRREGREDVEIEFDVHYLVQVLDGEAKVFGWVAGDEQAVLRQHGII